MYICVCILSSLTDGLPWPEYRQIETPKQQYHSCRSCVVILKIVNPELLIGKKSISFSSQIELLISVGLAP